MSKSYMDIGHGLDAEHSTLWKLSWTEPSDPEEYARPFLEVVSARTGTHETIWGKECIRTWRGRCDTVSREVSVFGPVNAVLTPDSLVAQLVKEFGDDIQVWRFPSGEKVR